MVLKLAQKVEILNTEVHKLQDSAVCVYYEMAQLCNFFFDENTFCKLLLKTFQKTEFFG